MVTKPDPKLPRIELLHVLTPTGHAGRLAKTGQHSFVYDTAALERAERGLEISLTMPLRADAYSSTPMLPVFQTFLPEGFLKERITARFGKVMRVDDMALLAFSGENAIGRLRLCRSASAESERDERESLSEILADQGSRDLFEYLSDKYLIRSGIAGVQPKVMLTAEADLPSATTAHEVPHKSGIAERATLRARQLIVKVGGEDYPGLAENEYHCLRIAADLELPVPPLWLSADRKRLVLERFDYDALSGSYLGFEDMVSLQGVTNERKYEGSHEMVARAIANNASPALLQSSLEQYFSSVVLSIVLQNGDAHLKNFGMLYTDPGTDDCRLSPIYDIVCTTVYIPKDRLALALARSRDWPDRTTLCEFGRVHCGVDHPEPVIDRALQAVASYVPDNDDSGIWRRIRDRVAEQAPALQSHRRAAATSRPAPSSRRR
jgi:serine/threonine-protein kinase HipA